MIVAAGCGSDEGSPPAATAPPELSDCVDPTDASDEAACLDQIEAFIESDIAGVDDAIERVNDALATASSSSFEFDRVTPAGEGYDRADPGDAIELRWRVGTTERTMFLCSSGASYEVGPDPCPG